MVGWTARIDRGTSCAVIGQNLVNFGRNLIVFAAVDSCRIGGEDGGGRIGVGKVWRVASATI